MDDKLIDCLDKLNEEYTSDLLEKDINFDIDKKTLKRIKTSVYKKIGTNKRKIVLSRKLIACIAAVILIISTTFLTIGFDNIVAAVKQAVEYIPGFGKVPENYREKPEDSRNSENNKNPEDSIKNPKGKEELLQVKVMKNPVYIKVNGEKIEFYSCWLSIYNDKIIVTTILHYSKNVSLNGEIKIEYNEEEISRDGEFCLPVTDDDKFIEMTYTYTIKNPKNTINNLTFKTDNSRADVDFENAEDLAGKAISQNFNGIIISAIPLNKNRSKFILNSTYEENIEGVEFNSSLSAGSDCTIKAVDEAGNEHKIIKAATQGSEYYAEGVIKGNIVSLKFNKMYLGFRYKNNNSMQGVTFKSPKNGEIVNINKSIDNNLCIINLKTVERGEITNEYPSGCLIFTFEMKSKIPNLDINYTALYVEKNAGVTGCSVLEKYKRGDSYIVKCAVIADINADYNTVNIVPYHGSYFTNELLLDKECILNFK